MPGGLYRRVRLGLLLTLCAAWLVTPLIAAFCASMPVHCNHPMPCCPTDGNARQCPQGLCPAEVSQKAELLQAAGTQAHSRLEFVAQPAPAPMQQNPVHELTVGLHYSPPVFRLKDDLRI